jgi:hypothetical protein
MNNLAHSLARRDASAFFAVNCETLFEQFASLSQNTTFLPNTTCRDHRVLEAFGALNAAIASGGPFSRLAYIRLAETLSRGAYYLPIHAGTWVDSR